MQIKKPKKKQHKIFKLLRFKKSVLQKALKIRVPKFAKISINIEKTKVKPRKLKKTNQKTATLSILHNS